MAGRGSRLRPHTLTVPKPLVPVGGKPIVHRLVEDIAKVINQPIEEIAFIIHESFGKDVEENLKRVAAELGSKGIIYYQNEPLGTGHAIMCAKESMTGPIVVAYADTLFKADFTLDAAADSVIWVKQVEDPSAFGVVQLNERNQIVDFVEKPKEFVSDLAIIGIYYFKSGETLRSELQFLLDNNVTKGGEYQLTDGLENMKQKGLVFVPGKVDEWLDCGNKEVTVYTNQRVLEYDLEKGKKLVADTAILRNAVIIPPCFIGDGAVIEDAVIGPHVSIGAGSHVAQSVISNSNIQQSTTIKNAVLENSMIGSFVSYTGLARDLSLGDYSTIKE